jgi:hypothetical protein
VAGLGARAGADASWPRAMRRAALAAGSATGDVEGSGDHLLEGGIALCKYKVFK